MNFFINSTKTTSFYEQIRALVVISNESEARTQLAFTLLSKNLSTAEINRMVFGQDDLKTIIKKNKKMGSFIQKV